MCEVHLRESSSQVSAVRTVLPKLSEETQQLKMSVLKLHWISCGVPLLVRKVLAVPVEERPDDGWSQVPQGPLNTICP